MDEAISRAAETAHAPTLANAYLFKAAFDALRDDAEAGRHTAKSLLEVSRAHSLGLYLAMGALFSSWAGARLGDRVAGMTEFRQTLAAFADKGNKMLAPISKAGSPSSKPRGKTRRAPSRGSTKRWRWPSETGERWTDALLHRIRGDILLKADPENPARAEDAYLAAITIAREQGARSFGLQAALKLAKLYQSAGRPAEAHAVLAPCARRLFADARKCRRSPRRRRCSRRWRKRMR